MATPDQVKQQIKFALAQLPAENGHFTLEAACRAFTAQRITPNVLPATGPVASGGDQGRDFESFRTFMRSAFPDDGAFVASSDEGAIAFICTTQQDRLRSKLLADLDKVMSEGTPVRAVYAFTSVDVNVAERHQIQKDARSRHNIEFEILDGNALAERLADPDCFWIATRFFALPLELSPSVEPAAKVPDGYVESRNRWRESDSPPTTYGDFLELKAAVRRATFDLDARGDLGFWLGLLRSMLDAEGAHALEQALRYEIAVATLRGHGTLVPADDLARRFLDEALVQSEPMQMRDAVILLQYVVVAVGYGQTRITAAEVIAWQDRAMQRLRSLADGEELLTRRLVDLFCLGYLCIQQRPVAPAHPEPIPEVSTLDVDQLSADEIIGDPLRHLISPNGFLEAWSEVARRIPDCPLFPVEWMSDLTQLLAPVLIDLDGWRDLVDEIDAAVSSVAGRSIAAERARDRAFALGRIGRIPEAIRELHQAKVNWWSGDTLRGALLAMLALSQYYLELRLPIAARALALSAGYGASGTATNEHADLVPAALSLVARSDFQGGRWHSASEHIALALRAHNRLLEDGGNLERHPEIASLILLQSQIQAASKSVDPGLTAELAARFQDEGVAELLAEAHRVLELSTETDWLAMSKEELVSEPFCDLGRSTTWKFSALGLDWRVKTQNRPENVDCAERFLAILQILVADLADTDLCVPSARIDVEVIPTQRAPHRKDQLRHDFAASGQRWQLKLSGSGVLEAAEQDLEVVAAITSILLNNSVLKTHDFYGVIEKSFARGLPAKIGLGRSYDELAASHRDLELDHPSDPASFRESPFGDELRFLSHPALTWRQGPGPGYSNERGRGMAANRYEHFERTLVLTTKRLARHKPFLRLVQDLRELGWLDWHIQTAVFNLSRNFRFPVNSPKSKPGMDPRSELMERWSAPEEARDKPVPRGLFTEKSMNQMRQTAIPSLMHHWGLELRQGLVDFEALEGLLGTRFGYWTDDSPHEDPYPLATSPDLAPGSTVARPVTSPRSSAPLTVPPPSPGQSRPAPVGGWPALGGWDADP